MLIKEKFLKKSIILLVLLGFIFPIKAPVSSAKAKMCCKSKGHCLMSEESGAKISVMGRSDSAKMIACCQDNCLSCSDDSILHPRSKHSVQYIGMSPTSAPFVSIEVKEFFLNTGPPYSGPPNSRNIIEIHSPPIFQLHSIFLL